MTPAPTTQAAATAVSDGAGHQLSAGSVACAMAKLAIGGGDPAPTTSGAGGWRTTPLHRAQRPPGFVELDYRNKMILAPMVRVGTLPMRLLSLKYGADIVYSPETIDRRLMKSNRVVNPITGTIDFIDQRDGSTNLRLHPSEKEKLVVQLGSSDPSYAVAAAMAVVEDASGIDLNCGCPKRFSVVSAMGAALLSDPDRLCAILTALVENVPLPITCKIRMLETTEKTVDLVKRIEKTGVSAIGLHCRTRNMRPTDPGSWAIFEPIAGALSIPLIANGDIFDMEDVERLRAKGVVSSFMMARGPQLNYSVFSKDGGISTDEAVIEYTKTAILYDMPFHNAKYTLSQMWPGEKNPTISQSRSFSELCAKLGLSDYYEKTVADRVSRAKELNRMDLLTEDVFGILGPDCPYLPDAPFLPDHKKKKLQLLAENKSKKEAALAVEDDEGLEGVCLW